MVDLGKSYLEITEHRNVNADCLPNVLGFTLANGEIHRVGFDSQASKLPWDEQELLAVTDFLSGGDQDG